MFLNFSSKRVRLEKLENLNCEGCENLSDNAFKFILISSTVNIFKSACHQQTSHECQPIIQVDSNSANSRSEQSHDRCADCANSKRSIEELHRLGSNHNHGEEFIDVYHGGFEQKLNDDDSSCSQNYDYAVLANSLRSINLSGCWSITDSGLRYIFYILARDSIDRFLTILKYG